jgi:hypothetical protein
MASAMAFALGAAGCGSVSRGGDDDGMPSDASADDDGSSDDDGGDDAVASCSDEELNQDETDVDCGGPCDPCPPHKHCAVPTDCSTGSCVDTFCALVSGPPSWIDGPDLPTYIGSMVAGLGDDTIWVLRGTRVAFLVGGGWTEVPLDDPLEFQIPFSDMAVVGDGTNVWTIGGRESDGLRVDRAWGLPPAAAAWTQLAPIDPGRSSLAAAIGPDGKVYAIGGSPEPSANKSAYGSAVESYQPPPAAPGVRTWDPAPADLPFGIIDHAAATAGDHIYVPGGRAFTGYLASTLRWKPGDAAWSEVADLPSARANHGAATAGDGRLYVVGGDDDVNPLDVVVAYSPQADHWFPVASLPAGPRASLGVTLGPDGRIWAIGGAGAASVGTVEIYGPELEISPLQGPVGTQIQIGGSNFAASATVSIRVGSLDSPEVGTAETNEAGALTTPVVFTVPEGTKPGIITIHAIDDRSHFPVRRQFEVN